MGSFRRLLLLFQLMRLLPMISSSRLLRVWDLQSEFQTIMKKIRNQTLITPKLVSKEHQRERCQTDNPRLIVRIPDQRDRRLTSKIRDRALRMLLMCSQKMKLLLWINLTLLYLKVLSVCPGFASKDKMFNRWVRASLCEANFHMSLRSSISKSMTS